MRGSFWKGLGIAAVLVAPFWAAVIYLGVWFWFIAAVCVMIGASLDRAEEHGG